MDFIAATSEIIKLHRKEPGAPQLIQILQDMGIREYLLKNSAALSEVYGIYPQVEKSRMVLVDLLACECGADALPLHPCPYQEDVTGDDKTLCACCNNCADRCADEI